MGSGRWGVGLYCIIECMDIVASCDAFGMTTEFTALARALTGALLLRGAPSVGLHLFMLLVVIFIMLPVS